MFVQAKVGHNCSDNGIGQQLTTLFHVATIDIQNAIYKIAGPKNIDKKRNDIFRKVSIESSNEIGLVSFLFNNNRRNYWKKEWVLNCTNAPFEFLNVTVPIAADEVLTKTYGNWRMFEKGMAMHSGIDFDVSKSYMEVLRDKYHYEEFKSYNSQKGKKLDYETERGGYYAPLLQMKIKRFMICYRALIEGF